MKMKHAWFHWNISARSFKNFSSIHNFESSSFQSWTVLFEGIGFCENGFFFSDFYMAIKFLSRQNSNWRMPSWPLVSIMQMETWGKVTWFWNPHQFYGYFSHIWNVLNGKLDRKMTKNMFVFTSVFKEKKINVWIP